LAEESTLQTGSAHVSIEQLETELRQLIRAVNNGTLFEQSWLAQALPEQRHLKDIAFSGDGEPTLSPQFAEAVRLAAEIRKKLCAESTKIVLITNTSTLHLDSVRSTLDFLLQNNGEIWAKLDAGTSDYFRIVSRSSLSFQTIRSNLINFSRDFPVVIQTCFLSLHGNSPSTDEVRRYAECLTELDKVQYVQIYTAARNMPEDWVKPLDNSQIDDIAENVRQWTRLDVRTFYSR
jgi:wyosine [tRNA(Phe)-imidazoG37] synthetase (radical SAM superfamily)